MQQLLQQQLEAARSWMEERLDSGRVRECHGDLHCSNIVRRDSRLTAFDCLEFEPAFRWIDVADEVAFLRADLAALDRPAHAQAFLGGYLAYSGDFYACRFLRTYEAHRSLVRAKVVSLSTPEAAVARRNANVHLDRAWRSLQLLAAARNVCDFVTWPGIWGFQFASCNVTRPRNCSGRG
jgi:aminoglycoside phosphotransferase family enzyme